MRSLAQLAGYTAVIDGFQELKEQVGGDRTTWAVGTNTRYGLYLEDGTRQMQAYPWLVPALHDVVNNKGDKIADEVSSTDELVERIALEVEAQAKANVSAGPEQTLPRSPGTHPDHPKRVTTNLVGSIEAVEL